MGVRGKLEIEVDIKTSGDVFHELLGTNPHHIPDIVPDKVHSFELQEGDVGQPDSLVEWNYTCEGKNCVAKQLVEEVNEEKKFVRYKLVEGSTLLEDLKSLTVTLQVIRKGEIDAIIWTFEFEKYVDIGPYPTSLMDLAIVLTRDIEAHHLDN